MTFAMQKSAKINDFDGFLVRVAGVERQLKNQVPAVGLAERKLILQKGTRK